MMSLEQPWKAVSLLAVMMAASAPVAGCGTTCTLDARPGVMVVVTDGAGGPRVCDATVTARQSGFSEVLMKPHFGGDASDAGGGCTYYGLTERPGTYDIEIVHGSRMKSVRGVKLDEDACHVETEKITVALDP